MSTSFGRGSCIALITIRIASRVNLITPSVQIPRSSYEREVRIKCLEEAALALDAFGKRLAFNLRLANYFDCEVELRRMANELKGAMV